MINPMKYILRNATKNKTEPVKALTIVTHERYEPNLAKANIDITALTGPGTRDWNPKVSPIPPNYKIIKIDELSIKAAFDKIGMFDFDCVISQNRFGQYQLLSQLAKLMHIPLICIEHTDIMPYWDSSFISQLSQMRGDINIYISEYNKERWLGHKSDIVIEHGIDTELFSPSPSNIARQNHILSMCNDWIGRDIPCGYSVWKRVTQNLPVRVVGETPGLSKGSSSLSDCINEFRTSEIFLNTSQYSPIPMSLMEAMSCECAIVTSATCMIPEVITNGKNGFISNNEKNLTKYCVNLLSDAAMCREIGANARNLIKNNFGLDKFINSWNTILESI